MRIMKIFEPAMCCPTGLCGVSVDPELLRISSVLNTLKKNGIVVQRYNLTGTPMEFVNNQAVSEFLNKFGPEKLPVVLVDDVIVIAGRYPTNSEFTVWLELASDLLGVQTECCTDTGCCCGDSGEEINAGCCCGDSEETEVNCCCDEERTSGCC